MLIVNTEHFLLLLWVRKRVKGDENISAPELCNRLVLVVSQYISHVVSCYPSTKGISVNWPWLTQISAIYNPHASKNILLSFSLPRDWSLLHIMLSWFHSLPVPAWQTFPLLPECLFLKSGLAANDRRTPHQTGDCVKSSTDNTSAALLNK